MNGARSAHLESAHVLVRPPRAAVEFYGAGYESVRDTWRWPQELHGSALAPPPLSRVLTRFEFYVSCSRNVSTAGDPPRGLRIALWPATRIVSPVRGDTAAHCSTNSRLFFGESKLIYYNVWCIVIKVVGLYCCKTVCLNTVFTRGGMLTALMGCKKNHNTSTT